MTKVHKSKIREYFNAGESDKVMKKSPALMLEALQADADDHEKHYAPFVLEMTPYISLLILTGKRGLESSGDGSRGPKGRSSRGVPRRARGHPECLLAIFIVVCADTQDAKDRT